MSIKRAARAALAVLLGLTLLLPAASARAEQTVTVRFYDPLDCTVLTLAAGESLTLAPGPEIEGYRFLGWQDDWGNYERRETLRVYEDADYYAVYTMALRDSAHAPYLTLDEYGFFRPQESVSRREAALLLYSLLETELVGDGAFLDVAEDDPCHDAAATLKALGALTGSRFHPDETITRRELLSLLAHFYPLASGSPVFSDLREDDPDWPAFALAAALGWIEEGEAAPDAELTRAELAYIMNRVLGRSGDSERREELVGTFYDVPRSDPYYWDVAEAVIPHSCETDESGEHWTHSEAQPTREPGLFFAGVRLHALGEDGEVVHDGEYQGLRFNSRGEVTSGLEELDELIWEAMAGQVDPRTMSREEMLKAMFDYTVKEFRYVGGNLYKVGQTGWEQQEALHMLQTHKGNCYSFAAVFYYFARALGYDATAYSGSVKGEDGKFNPHGWVEIPIDGEIWMFDPEMQYLKSVYQSEAESPSFYMRDSSLRHQYSYYWHEAEG